jgi:hypothetical protein
MKKLFVIMVAMMALVAFAGSAWAQATEPGPSAVLGGRLMTDFGYQNLSKELTTNKKDDVTSAFINVNGQTYLRGTWTSADKTTGGLIELSAAAAAGDSESVGLRYAYGWWKVGNCQLVAGQTDGWLGSLAYAPSQMLFGGTQSGKGFLINYGTLYSGRSPQVRFEWTSGAFGFSVAAVQPAAEQVTTISGADMYANVPRFDLAAQFKAGGLMTTPAFGWSQLKYQGVASGWDDSYNSWVVTLPVKYTVGPFTAKFQIHTGANTENEWYGEATASTLRTIPKIVPVFSATGKEYDTRETGGQLSLEYQVGALTVVGSYAMVKIDNDYWKGSNGYKNDNYDRKAWLLGLPYAVTKNFTIIPEFHYYMYGDSPQTGADMGNEWLLGLEFKFVF